MQNAGGAGGNTTLANVGTVNAGGGSNAGPSGGGTAGNQPGASFTYPTRAFIVGSSFGAGGAGANPNPNPQDPPMGSGAMTGRAGTAGVLVIFENTGT
jgi:hypothetical protein